MTRLPLAQPLLSAGEEAELARLIEAGVAAAAVLSGEHLRVDAERHELERIAAQGEQARERFLLSNLRLVAFAMAGLVGREASLSRHELFQEGVVSMAEALRRYDPQRGRFSTLAYPAVRGSIQVYVAASGGALGVPARRAQAIRRARVIAARLAETGQPARVSDVATELGRDEAATKALLGYKGPVALESKRPYAQERILAVLAPDFDETPVPDLSRLPGDQRAAITLRYGLADGQPRSCLEVGAELGVSKRSAHRLLERALVTLRGEQAAAAAMADDPAAEAATLARSHAAAATLREVDRLSKAGLSLVEVAIALKTEPRQLHDLCQAGRRPDLLARFGRLEQAYGFEPGPYTAPYVVETAESARRRDRFRTEAAALEQSTTPAYETVTPPAKHPGAAGLPRRVEGRSVSW
jgi:RNA polymerase sigma factor (sigma-70 family)